MKNTIEDILRYDENINGKITLLEIIMRDLQTIYIIED